MGNFIITADSNCDLDLTFLKEKGVRVIDLSYIIEGVTYTNAKGLTYPEFYEKVRKGAMPTTTQVNPTEAEEMLREALTECKNILHIGFSSALSGSYNSVRVAANEIMEDDSTANIKVIDSLSAAAGEGLLVYKAVKMQEAGKTLEEAAAEIEDLKLHICHNFTVDDLNHLQRGGRVSKATALIGTMVNIKPILCVNDAGELINIDKTRGRKKSLNALVDSMVEQIKGYEDQNEDMIMIGHGDCIDDANYIKEKAAEKTGFKNFTIDYIGPVIGSHAGPGTVVIAFVGSKRCL